MKNEIFKSQGVASITLKFCLALVVALLMLVPLHLIGGMSEERDWRYKDTRRELVMQLGGASQVDVAIRADYVNVKGVRMPYFLEPSQVEIKADMRHKLFKRGRHEVLGWGSNQELHMEGDLPRTLAGVNSEIYTLDSASVRVVAFNALNDDKYLDTVVACDGQRVVFDGVYKIDGAEALEFIARGDYRVDLTGDWRNPDLAVGSIIARERKITNTGFSALWHVKSKTKNIYASTDSYISGRDSRRLGVELLLDVSQYQMTERTIKYGLLVIVLTFVAFLLTEMLFRVPINLIQYLLSGFALVLFYSLLLSLSEYMRFQYAYLAAATMTIGMVFIYIRNIFGKLKPALIIAAMLCVLYAYIYILTQMVELSLLAGSMGLFVILAVVMYVSQHLFKRIAAEKKNADPQTPEPKIVEEKKVEKKIAEQEIEDEQIPLL